MIYKMKVADLVVVAVFCFSLVGCDHSTDAPKETDVAAEAQPPDAVQAPTVSTKNGEMNGIDYAQKTTVIPVVAEADLKTIRNEGTFWSAPGNIVFDGDLDIPLTKKTNIKSIDISVDDSDTYEITGFVNNEQIHLATIVPTNKFGLYRHKIVLKEVVNGVDKIRITVSSGDGRYSVGHLLVNTQ
jgi:hypothetical protein